MIDASAQSLHCSLNLFSFFIDVAVDFVQTFFQINLCGTSNLLPSTLHFNAPSQKYEILSASGKGFQNLLFANKRSSPNMPKL